MFGSIDMPMLMFIFVVALVIFGPRWGAGGPFSR